MRDVSNKYNTLRSAIAEAIVEVSKSSIEAIRSNSVPKGDVFTVAKVAGVLAAKNVSQIIPYCHNIPVDFVDVRFELLENSIRIESEVRSVYKTGVEMEALTAVSVAALTVYDMLKMIDDTVVISKTRLVEKSGGKSDFITELDRGLKAGVLVLSDSISAGKKSDESGKIIVERLKKEGIDVRHYEILSDDRDQIEKRLIELCDGQKLDLILTTGGTGFSPRDNTPEATLKVIERQIYGIPEAIRAYGQDRTPYSMLSRGVAGIRGSTIIVNLPGSRKGVRESLDMLFPALFHSFKMLWMGGH
jgi:molybdenum cofactor biosynthesis protein MoaC